MLYITTCIKIITRKYYSFVSPSIYPYYTIIFCPAIKTNTKSKTTLISDAALHKIMGVTKVKEKEVTFLCFAIPYISTIMLSAVFDSMTLSDL